MSVSEAQKRATLKWQKEKTDEIKDKYDYIIIDCPPSLGLITLNAFTAANSVLIPIQCEYYALEGLRSINKYN